jgi:bile acid-coenzyme A ligase
VETIDVPPVSYGRRISDLAAERPDDTALIFAPREGAEQRLSWRDLEHRSLQVADLLAERGVGQGSMVVIGLPNCVEHVLTAIAAWKLGACTLPLRWDLPVPEREALMELSRPTVVVSAEWPEGSAPSISLQELRASTSRPATPLPDRVAEPARAMASSGSTGRPKLIVKPGPGQAVPRSPMGRIIEDPPVPSTELIPAPLYHTNGFMLLHVALFNGDCMVLMERYSPEQAVDLIERHRPHFVTMVPIMLMRIARLPDIAKRDLSSLLAVMQGGASMPHWLARAWIDLVGPERLHLMYGSTEGAGATRIDGVGWLEHPGSVGLPFHSEIRILDDDLRPLPPGEVGEIFGRMLEAEGPTFEYLGAAPPKCTPDGFASVGDLGWLDEQGYLYIADRRVDMLISGGANVFPAEVESVLFEHPAVVDAVVIGLPDEEWGQRVHALVQLREGVAEPTDEELRSFCRERLAAYKLPKTIERVPRLARTDAGKLNRSALVAERTA